MTIPSPKSHRPEFSIGTAFEQTHRILGENFLVFALLYGALSIPSLLIGELVGLNSLIGWVVYVVVAGATLAIAEVQITRWAYAARLGEGREKTAAGLPSEGIWGRAIGAYILVTAVGIIGLLMLILPGIILAILLFFVIPAIVIDNQDIWGSIERSIRVAEGNRGPVYMAIFFYVAIYIAVAFAIQAMVGEAAIGIILNILWDGAAGAYGVVLALVLYEEMKAARKAA